MDGQSNDMNRVPRLGRRVLVVVLVDGPQKLVEVLARILESIEGGHSTQWRVTLRFPILDSSGSSLVVG